MSDPESTPPAEVFEFNQGALPAEEVTNPTAELLAARLNAAGIAYTVSTSSGPHPTTFIEGEWGTLVVYADGNFRYTDR